MNTVIKYISRPATPLLLCETFPKDFHVEILLRTWQEFDTLETAKAYCQKNTRHFDQQDLIIFDTGVLLFQR
jgi:hypothetical protein